MLYRCDDEQIIEGPDNINVQELYHEYTKPLIEHDKNRPAPWQGHVGTPEEFQASYKAYLDARQPFDDKYRELVAQLADGPYSDVTKGFVKHLINNHGFKAVTCKPLLG